MRRLSLLTALVFLPLAPQALASNGSSEEVDGSYLFTLAQVHRFEGSYNEALDAFHRAVAAVPDEPYLRREFAEFLFQLGRLNVAAEHAEVAYGAAPRSRDALRLLGRIHLRLAENSRASLQRAQEAFELLRQLDPNDIDVRVTLGRLHLSQARPEQAAAVLREARSLRPKDRLIASLLVEAVGSLGDGDDVLQELSEMVRDDPGFLQPRLALAQALSRIGDADAVVELLAEAPEEVRSNVDYLRQLAFAHYRTGSFDKSLAVGEQWLERRPQDTTARYLRSLTLAALGRDEDSEESLTKLLQENPDSQEFALALAEIIERRGRPAEAAELLRQVIARLEGQEQRNESRRVATVLVDLHARAGEWEEVLELTQTVFGQGMADDDPRRLLRSRALEELGREEEALDELDALAAVQGLEERVVARRAKILFTLGRESEAEQFLHKLTSSEDTAALTLAAEVLHEVQLFARAVPVLQRADRIDPSNLEIIFWLGASFERSGDFKAAEAQFQRLLDLDNDFAPALNYLGYMWAERGENLEEALELVQRAVALDPNNGAYLDSLGWAYFQTGQYEEAREHLERAALLVGDDAVVFEHLGDLYLAAGDRTQAEVAYRRALELEGENRSAVQRKLSEFSEQ
jgi:tetratricopeptide (TPR) repeat protein